MPQVSGASSVALQLEDVNDVIPLLVEAPTRLIAESRQRAVEPGIH